MAKDITGQGGVAAQFEFWIQLKGSSRKAAHFSRLRACHERSRRGSASLGFHAWEIPFSAWRTAPLGMTPTLWTVSDSI